MPGLGTTWARGDLHQASEKGWGAAAHMGKAVALAQGWQYEQHSHFHLDMNQAARLTDSDRLPFLHGRAEILHANLYELGPDLDAEIIRQDLTSMADLLDPSGSKPHHTFTPPLIPSYIGMIASLRWIRAKSLLSKHRKIPTGCGPSRLKARVYRDQVDY